jgi:hypothetical protein
MFSSSAQIFPLFVIAQKRCFLEESMFFEIWLKHANCFPFVSHFVWLTIILCFTTVWLCFYFYLLCSDWSP